MNDAVATELELLRGIFYDDGLLIEERSSEEEEDGSGGGNGEKEARFCPSGVNIPFYFTLTTLHPLFAPGISYPHHPFTLPSSLSPAFPSTQATKSRFPLSVNHAPKIPSLQYFLSSFPSLSLLLPFYRKTSSRSPYSVGHARPAASKRSWFKPDWC